jgi:hypothetical protein
MPHYFHGGQLHHHAGLAPTPNHIFAEHVNMPRNANPYPYPEPLPAEGLRDFGEFLNSSNKDASYFHGLTGVDQYLNYLLTNALVAMFFIGLAVVLWYRWTLMGHAHLRKLMAMGKESDQRYWMYNHHKTWASIKKNILYAPLGKVRHNQEYRIPFVKKADSGMGTLPSRFHTFLLVILVVTNLAYCLALDWSALDSSAVIAELRGRTGQLAALNIIPTVLFALRNNPLLWITGVSYDCFNLLHRWCARIMIIEAVLHTLAWAINVHKASGAAQVALSLSTSKSFAWGMVATVCFGTIFVVAPAPIRHTFYETFLNGHRLLVLFALVGVYVHLDAANLPQLREARVCALGSRTVLEDCKNLLSQRQPQTRYHQGQSRGVARRGMPRYIRAKEALEIQARLPCACVSPHNRPVVKSSILHRMGRAAHKRTRTRDERTGEAAGQQPKPHPRHQPPSPKSGSSDVFLRQGVHYAHDNSDRDYDKQSSQHLHTTRSKCDHNISDHAKAKRHDSETLRESRRHA